MDPVLERLGAIGLVPVLRVDATESAVALGRTLAKSGLLVAEVTFRSAMAVECIRAMASQVPDLLVGAGTVLTAVQAAQAIEAGARFIVSPAFIDEVVDCCLECRVPVLPGISNPDGVVKGLARGLEVFKFFPATVVGGTAMLDALSGPFPTVQFVPTGGIHPDNLEAYARHPQVLAIAGSWMVRRELVDGGRWEEVEQLCRQAMWALHGFRFAGLGLPGGNEAGRRECLRIFGGLLGFPVQESGGSVRIANALEFTRTPGPDGGRYLAIACNQVERAITYFASAGIECLKGTARMEQGTCRSIDLDLDVGGFVLRLVHA